MSKRKKQIKSKIGKPPGTLIYVGESKIEKASVTYTEYSEEIFEVKKIEALEELRKINDITNESVKWIDVKGLTDVEFLAKFGELFKIHPLIMEDVVNSLQHPKVEYYGEDIFVVLKKINLQEKKDIVIEQVSLFLTANYVFTFSDDEGESYSSVHQRIRTGKNVFRKSKGDYLFYVLTDYVIDGYFLVLEELSERIEELQEQLLENPGKDDLQKIQLVKKEAHKIKQVIKPVREIINSLVKQESDHITKAALIYLRDSYDHIIQITETMETQRESITTLIDIYLSSVSNRMNEVMKLLTIIATIFIPLTFIAGVYGMNFANMPELHWKYGYPIILSIMIVVGVVLVLYFRKKKWL